MSDLFDYLTWRGDLSLGQAPFNDVDSLILCALSYLRFDGVVPGPGGGAIALKEAAARLFALREAPMPDPGTRDFDEHNLLLLDALAQCRRFAHLPLSGYVSAVDTSQEKQFAALTIGLGGGEGYVAFRGTDDTLVGWKEDFNLAFLPAIPSQADAASYLCGAAGRFETLRVGGHSKGGNLAVYAAVHCGGPVQEQIAAVYNNDGPGFPSPVLESRAYRNIRERVHTFVPQSSVVGMLLDHEEDYTVVNSSQVGLLQHDPYSWQVLGPRFHCRDTVTNGSRFLDHTLREWVSSMDALQRERFVDGLFEILSATGAATTGELTADWLKSAGSALQALRDMDEDTRRTLTHTLGQLIRAARESLPAAYPRPGQAQAKQG